MIEFGSSRYISKTFIVIFLLTLLSYARKRTQIKNTFESPDRVQNIIQGKLRGSSNVGEIDKHNGNGSDATMHMKDAMPITYDNPWAHYN